MSIEGRIAVDVGFLDRTDATSVQSIKKISLSESTGYTSGKVAVVTGTCSTARVSIPLNPSAFRDASGSFVTFSTVSRIALAATPAACAAHKDIGVVNSTLSSRAGRVSVTESLQDAGTAIEVFTTSGTATYTLAIYGT